MLRVIHFSGGVGSWATGRTVRDKYPDDPMVLLFADTLIEDDDTYRYLQDAADNIGLPLTRIADGRTPWEVFKDERFLGNTRADPCSKILKRRLLRKWLEDNCDPADTINYIGIDWTEIDRFEKAKPLWAPWQLEAPLTQTSLCKDDLHAWATDEGIKKQRLYELGMPHANCGGACVKAGQGHFVKLLNVLPDVFDEWETKEEEIRQFLGKDVAILRDRRGGVTKPLTLRNLRLLNAEDPDQLDLFDFGGCGCAL